MFCVIHFDNSLQSANVLLVLSQTAKRYKYYMREVLDKSLLHRPHGTGNLHSNALCLGGRYLSALIAQRLARSLRKRKVPSLNPIVDNNFSFCYSRFALLTG